MALLSPNQKQRILEMVETEGVSCSKCGSTNFSVEAVWKTAGERYMASLACEHRCLGRTVVLIEEAGFLRGVHADEIISL